MSPADLWNLAQPTLQTVLIAVFMALAGWVAMGIQKKTGIDIEAGHRDALHSALETGVGMALSKVGALMPTTQISSKNAIIDMALSYVLKAVPDAVKAFGLTDAKLATMLESKLEQMLGLPAAVVVAPVAVTG